MKAKQQDEKCTSSGETGLVVKINIRERCKAVVTEETYEIETCGLLCNQERAWDFACQ